MDINGARELAERVGPKAGSDRGPLPSESVSELAPPVYHWFGIDLPDEAQQEREPTADSSPGAGERRLWRRGLRRG
jgi:hypothetical protein